MEAKRYEDEAHDAGRSSVDPREAQGFNLAELCLSPLDSPAMTTAASGSGALSALSDGLSLATDDKDDCSNGGEESSENNHHEGKEADTEDAGVSREHSNAMGENAKDTSDQSDSPACEQASKGDEDAVTEPNDTALETVPPIATHVQQPPQNDSSDSDEEDMTVECASPRDPTDLEDDILLATGAQTRSKTSYSSTSTPEPSLVLIPTQASAATPAETSQAVYSVKTLFPVVYETPIHTTVRSAQPTNSPDRPQRSQQRTRQMLQPTEAVGSVTVKVTAKGKPSTPIKGDTIVGGIINPRNEPAPNAAKSLTLQLHVAETERKQLAQRNARLKSQLATLTTDLVRTKADAAKWKTENELYAAKMPKLQAELSEETTQVDEKQAQAIQSQLEITQLRAKVQVLQTRAGNLDMQVEKLQNELCAAKKDLRRRTALQQQTDEKVKRLEIELHGAKTTHAQEFMQIKQKLASTVQRLNYDHVRKEAELKKTHHQQLEDTRAALAKATKRWKDLEHGCAASEHELSSMKKRLEEFVEEARARDRQAKALETVFARAERTESTLRTQVCSLKAQIKVLEREKSKMVRGVAQVKPIRANVQSHNKTSSASLPSPVAPRKSETTHVLCSCCQMVADSMTKAERLGEEEENDGVLEATPPTTTPQAACSRCIALTEEVTSAQEKIAQLRTLHTSELKVQASAYERVLAAFRRAEPSPQCA